VPTIPDISTVGGVCGLDPDTWCFVNRDIGLGVTVTSISPVAVDEPTMLSLFAIGLGVLLQRLPRRAPAG
jgi:hypothetical protein